AERRRLVLQLLGITPLELARDRARRDARTADDQLQRLRQVLPELDRLRAGVVEAEAAVDIAAEADCTAEAAADEAAEDLETARANCERREAVRQRHDLLVERGRAVRGEHDAALRRAEEAVARSSELSGEAHCPTCGQPLGGAFEQVQSHRAAELAEAEAAVERLVVLQSEAASRAHSADRRAEQLRQQLRAARERWTQWLRVVERREAAVAELTDAITSLEDAATRSGGAWRVPVATVLSAIEHPSDGTFGEPTLDDARLARSAGELRDAVRAGRAAVAECDRLRGRLERRQTAAG